MGLSVQRKLCPVKNFADIFTEIYGALAFIDIINMPEKFQRNPWSKSL